MELNGYAAATEERKIVTKKLLIKDIDLKEIEENTSVVEVAHYIGNHDKVYNPSEMNVQELEIYVEQIPFQHYVYAIHGVEYHTYLAIPEKYKKLLNIPYEQIIEQQRRMELLQSTLTQANTTLEKLKRKIDAASEQNKVLNNTIDDLYKQSIFTIIKNRIKRFRK